MLNKKLYIKYIKRIVYCTCSLKYRWLKISVLDCRGICHVSQNNVNQDLVPLFSRLRQGTMSSFTFADWKHPWIMHKNVSLRKAF